MIIFSKERLGKTKQEHLQQNYLFLKLPAAPHIFIKTYCCLHCIHILYPCIPELYILYRYRANLIQIGNDFNNNNDHLSGMVHDPPDLGDSSLPCMLAWVKTFPAFSWVNHVNDHSPTRSIFSFAFKCKLHYVEEHANIVIKDSTGLILSS